MIIISVGLVLDPGKWEILDIDAMGAPHSASAQASCSFEF